MSKRLVLSDSDNDVDYLKTKLVIGSRDAVMHPRIKKVFIRATQAQVEIQRWYEESQENGAEIAYELRREADLSSKMAARGIETSYNGKFSSDGGILDVDYHWAKSITRGIIDKILPAFVGPRKNGVRVNEENIARLISDAGTGFALIQWCHGQVIKGKEGKGVLVKFNGFVYLQLGSGENRMKVIK